MSIKAGSLIKLELKTTRLVLNGETLDPAQRRDILVGTMVEINSRFLVIRDNRKDLDAMIPLDNISIIRECVK